ncbi:MAG: ATPase domain-containing protein, partial [Acetobacter malorum]
MAKRPARQFACRACGAVYPKWMGQCEACGEWNTLEEIAVEPLAASSPRASSKGRRVKLEGLEGMAAPPPRIRTGIEELDRVLGGGLVPASVVLVGGDPGIGKSTLLLQAACKLAAKSERVLYISGEEAVDQIRLRALRLGVGQATLDLAASINVADIVATLEAEPDVRVVVIDSIQTMWLETVESAPGSVSQVRACAFELIRLAKRKG